MATKNAINLSATVNADGFTLEGGTTSRALTVTGGPVTLTGSGSVTTTLPPVASTVARVDSLAYDYVVYKSGATTIAVRSSDSSNFSSNADASVVVQACVDAIDASGSGGGKILIKPGTYDFSTVVTVQGTQATDSPMVSIHGSGIQATIIKPSVNVTAFTFSQRAKFSIRDLAIIVRGSGNGITTTNSSTAQRACWLSEIRNIYIYDDSSSTAHSGWGLDLGNFFRSQVENIDMNQVKNGMRLSALGSSAFNPGDCTFTRMFIELASGSAGGTAIQLSSNVGGRMNQCNFSMIEMIGTGTGQTAILLDGTAGNNYNRFWGINVEEFATLLDIEYGRGNTFDFNYVITIDAASTTYFKTTVNAFANRISAAYAETYTQTVTMINDAQTSFNERNRFEHISIQGTAGTVTFTRVDATYLYDIFDNSNDGTKSVLMNTGTAGSVSANAVTVQGTAGSFTDTTDINADTTRTAITLTNQAIRSSSVVSCFMMSAPDANAMLVASATCSDGSASVVIRNCGTGNQTSTFTIGFIVQQ
jgi:hypothetical protein